MQAELTSDIRSSFFSRNAHNSYKRNNQLKLNRITKKNSNSSVNDIQWYAMLQKWPYIDFDVVHQLLVQIDLWYLFSWIADYIEDTAKNEYKQDKM